MIILDVEEQKKTVFELNEIEPFEEEMTFYYDESGNCRKFYLTDTGFNDSDAIKGRWEKAWIRNRVQYAINKKINLFEAMWEGYSEKMEHMPKSMFKFYPFNHNSLKCLETNAVFMNDPNNFNDPFDCVLCANKNEYLKQSLIDYLTKTNAVSRGILSLEEFDKLKYSYCGDWENVNVYSTFDSVVSHICYDTNMREYFKMTCILT